jgi:predicted dehydrogenase
VEERGLSGNPRVRVGVVGLGLIGQIAHLPNLTRLSDSFVVTHVSDLSDSIMTAVAAGLPGTPRCSVDAADLMADPEVDAVLLLTPGAHAPLAEAALRAGKHVLSEKPFCITQDEAKRLGRMAAEADLVLQVAYMKAYDPAMPAARAALAEIGDVQLVSVEVRHPTQESQIANLPLRPPGPVDLGVVRAAEAAEIERTTEALGDAPVGLARLYREVLLGSVIHELAALRALGFEVPAAWQHIAAWPFDAQAAAADPPSLAATANLDGGALLRLQWLWLPDYPRYEETISVIGSAGAIRLEMPQPYGPNVPARLHVRGSDGSGRVVEDGRQYRDSGFMEELRVFAAAVHGDKRTPTGADTARADTASLQAFAAQLARQQGFELGGEAAMAGQRS